MTCSLLPPTTGTLQGNSAYQHNSYKSQAKPKHLDRMCSDCQLWQPCCPVVQLPAAATFAVCLQHAKPQSQNVQHFLVPFAVLLCSRILLPFFRREQTNNCKIDMTDLSLINPTHSHTLSLSLFLFHCRYGRWVTRRVAVITIAAIWLLAAFVSFVPISLGIHRPDQPLIFEDNGKKYPTCALDLTPTYAVVSSCISFYFPCVVMIGIYCR